MNDLGSDCLVMDLFFTESARVGIKRQHFLNICDEIRKDWTSLNAMALPVAATESLTTHQLLRQLLAKGQRTEERLARLEAAAAPVDRKLFMARICNSSASAITPAPPLTESISVPLSKAASSSLSAVVVSSPAAPVAVVSLPVVPASEAVSLPAAPVSETKRQPLSEHDRKNFLNLRTVSISSCIQFCLVRGILSASHMAVIAPDKTAKAVRSEVARTLSFARAYLGRTRWAQLVDSRPSSPQDGKWAAWSHSLTEASREAETHMIELASAAKEAVTNKKPGTVKKGKERKKVGLKNTVQNIIKHYPSNASTPPSSFTSIWEKSKRLKATPVCYLYIVYHYYHVFMLGNFKKDSRIMYINPSIYVRV